MVSRPDTPRSTGDVSRLVEAAAAAGVPLPVSAVPALEAAGPERGALLRGLVEAEAEQRDDSSRVLVEAIYPALVTALAVWGIVSAGAWYGPLIGRVDDALTGPRAGARFDAQPVIDAIGWPALGVALLAAVAVAMWALVNRQEARRGARRRAGDGGGTALAAYASGIADAAARSAALAAVADHDRLQGAAASGRLGRSTAVAGSVVAGGAVLLYGLALFRPLVRLLLDVAAQPGVEVWRGGP